MTLDLLQRLRTSSVEERKAVAIAIAKIGSDALTTELIKMADGEIRAVTPRTWRTLWFRQKLNYSFEDQMTAIEALGKTNNPLALRYLQNLLVFTTHEGHSIEGGMQGNDFYPNYFYRRYEFPNAKGDLNKSMCFDGPHYGLMERCIDLGPNEIKTVGNPHRLIASSIYALESKL